MPGNPGTHLTWSSIYLSESRVCLDCNIPMWMEKKKYQEWHSPGTHCTNNNFATSYHIVFTSWVCLQIQVSLVHLLCVSIYLLKWNDHIFIFFHARIKAQSYIELSSLHVVLQVSGFIRTHIFLWDSLAHSLYHAPKQREKKNSVSPPPHKKPFSLCKQLLYFFSWHVLDYSKKSSSMRNIRTDHSKTPWQCTAHN